MNIESTRIFIPLLLITLFSSNSIYGDKNNTFLSNGNIMFAMSKEKINFYSFASFFKKQGCNEALYLDGFVSRAYLPSKKWTQTDGNFGVIIGVTE